MFCPPHIYKIIELVGSSVGTAEDAVRNAISKVAKTVKHVNWFEVVETGGQIVNGQIAHDQVAVKIGFRIEGERSTKQVTCFANKGTTKLHQPHYCTTTLFTTTLWLRYTSTLKLRPAIMTALPRKGLSSCSLNYRVDH